MHWRGRTLSDFRDLQGVKQVKKTDLNARFLFLQPPSVEVLEQRLRGRASDSEEAILARLKQAENDCLLEDPRCARRYCRQRRFGEGLGGVQGFLRPGGEQVSSRPSERKDMIHSIIH
jgi:hypothetical protein